MQTGRFRVLSRSSHPGSYKSHAASLFSDIFIWLQTKRVGWKKLTFAVEDVVKMSGRAKSCLKRFTSWLTGQNQLPRREPIENEFQKNLSLKSKSILKIHHCQYQTEESFYKGILKHFESLFPNRAPDAWTHGVLNPIPTRLFFVLKTKAGGHCAPPLAKHCCPSQNPFK